MQILDDGKNNKRWEMRLAMPLVNDCLCEFDSSDCTSSSSVRWSWACRVLASCNNCKPDTGSAGSPKPGDLALVRVDEIGNHAKLVTIDNKKLTIYTGDTFVGVFGNRYATDAFEGEVNGLENLSLLTAGGMIGTVKSRHKSVSDPTRLSFMGFINDEKGNRVNLKELNLFGLPQRLHTKNLIVVVGTGMNSGKTTSSVKLIKGLTDKGLAVAACKLTGSVSNRDQDEMRSASAKSVIDFSDYGFPSTYLCGKEELVALFNRILSDSENVNPDIIVMEIADGILQRETAMLLNDPFIKRMIKGIVLTAESAPSALYASEQLKNLGYSVIAVSGIITSSPLAVREFKERSGVPVGSSAGSGKKLVTLVSRFIEKEEKNDELSQIRFLSS